MNTRDAEELWASLRSALCNADNAIRLIIAEKAWRPLGYETFVEAWDARMVGIDLANSIKPYVIYAMLDESLTLEDIATSTGWGIDQVSRAADDYHHGVPVDGATVVRQHVRRAPGERTTVHISFSTDEMLWLNEVAKRGGRPLHDEAKRAIIAHFEKVESANAARRAS